MECIGDELDEFVWGRFSCDAFLAHNQPEITTLGQCNLAKDRTPFNALAWEIHCKHLIDLRCNVDSNSIDLMYYLSSVGAVLGYQTACGC